LPALVGAILGEIPANMAGILGATGTGMAPVNMTGAILGEIPANMAGILGATGTGMAR
jgi:hypothetical protein